jgi:hypothetical protein
VLPLLVLLLLARPAAAVELFDGRVQIHGFLEAEVRAISRNYSEQIDLTQWYWVGNLELEWDIAPDGFGPIDLMGAYVRIEARYDCVWSGGCGVFPSVNTYGNDAARLPDRLADARLSGIVGTLEPTAVETDSGTRNFSDKRRRLRIPLGQASPWYAFDDRLARPVPNRNLVGGSWNAPAIGDLFYSLPGLDPTATNPDGSPSSVDDLGNPIPDPGAGNDDVSGCATGASSPYPCRYAGAYVIERFADYRFGMKQTPGPFAGNGTIAFGPWRPRDDIGAWGLLKDRVNPHDARELHPVMRARVGDGTDDLRPLRGTTTLPFRQRAFLPAATTDAEAAAAAVALGEGPSQAPLKLSRGLYYPTAAFQKALDDPRFGYWDQNFSQDQLAWNMGAAQQQTGPLREAYLDLETLTSRLFLRIGLQTIVWGKTEIFRSQDQFNPQDFGLASLPTLEESRIPLWALRAIYSLYDVGPLEDVRLEGAVVFDRFQPVDIGRCGEPYAPQQACALSAGYHAHGLTGTGVAGEFRPRPAWSDATSIEFGGRIEWRWQRFSFSLTDFYGYSDFPHPEYLNTWERNVDPGSGRPRRAGARGPCSAGDEPACLGGLIAGELAGDPAAALWPGLARPGGTPTDEDPFPTSFDTLENHHGNQQLFATICATTLGLSATIPDSCAFNLFNSPEVEGSLPGGFAGALPTAAVANTAMLTGLGFADRAGVNNPAVNQSLQGKFAFFTLSRFETDGDRLEGSATDPARADEDRMPLATLHANRNGGAGNWVDGFPALPVRANVFPVVGEQFADAWRFVGLDPALTDPQEALLGCGNYWGTDCDIHGVDVFNAEGSVLAQSWPGFEGAGGADWDAYDGALAQPGTIFFDGGPVCTRYDPAQDATALLPGCRGANGVAIVYAPGASQVVVTFDPGYRVDVDGCVFAPTVQPGEGRFAGEVFDVVGRYPDGGAVDLSTCVAVPGQPPNVIETLYHPLAGCIRNGADDRNPGACILQDDNNITTRDFDADFLEGNAQVFRNEMAAVSWNFLMVLVASSVPSNRRSFTNDPDCEPEPNALDPDLCSDRPPRFDEFDVNAPSRKDGCSYRKPFLCKGVRGFFALTGAQRATRRAGGNPRYGRRDFIWHGGAVATLNYARRNVLGMSTDFAEDRTKTNWGVEFSWIDRVPMVDNDEFDGLTDTEHFNLAISVDRPTFIRFLNPSRTFFFNAQLFLNVISGWRSSFAANGPVLARTTFGASTGYWQDRLLPSLVWAHDWNSISGALIPTMTYRITQSFSVQIGLAVFYGRVQTKTAALVPIGAPSAGAGVGSQQSYVEDGLSSVRDRDEVFMRVRYTF